MSDTRPLGTAARWLNLEVTRLTAEWEPGTAAVTRALAVQAMHTGEAQNITRRFGVSNSALLTRYRRRHIATPKQQLALFRLTLALLVYHGGGHTTEQMANDLDFSSASAFYRHVGRLTGMRWRELVARYRTGADFWERVVARVILWDDARWTTMAALGPRRSILDLKDPTPRAAA